MTVSPKSRVAFRIKGIEYRPLYVATGPLKYRARLHEVSKTDYWKDFFPRPVTDKEPEILISIGATHSENILRSVSEIRFGKSTLHAEQKGEIMVSFSKSVMPDNVYNMDVNAFDIMGYNLAFDWTEVGFNFPGHTFNLDAEVNNVTLLFGKIYYPNRQVKKLKAFFDYFGHNCPPYAAMFIFSFDKALKVPEFTQDMPVQMLVEQQDFSAGSSEIFSFPVKNPSVMKTLEKMFGTMPGLEKQILK